MTVDELKQQFKKLGYLVLDPDKTDRTYTFIKHTNKGTRKIYVTYYKKSKKAEVESLFNYDYVDLETKEQNLIEKLIFEILEMKEYSYLTKE